MNRNLPEPAKLQAVVCQDVVIYASVSWAFIHRAINFIEAHNDLFGSPNTLEVHNHPSCRLHILTKLFCFELPEWDHVSLQEDLRSFASARGMFSHDSRFLYFMYALAQHATKFQHASKIIKSVKNWIWTQKYSTRKQITLHESARESANKQTSKLREARTRVAVKYYTDTWFRKYLDLHVPDFWCPKRRK